MRSTPASDERRGDVQPRISPLLSGMICGISTLKPALCRVGLIVCRVALNWMVPTMAIVLAGWKFRSKVARRWVVSIEMSTKT